MSHPYLQTAIDAAKIAGGIILTSTHHKTGVYTKGIEDCVTNIDLEAEAAIIAHIRLHYPMHNILTEETGVIPASQNDSNGDDVTWIIDPLDGTTNFIHRIAYFCVSIAIQVNGVIEHGVIYNPVNAELFTASKGAGSYLNGYRLHVPAKASAGNEIIVTGLAYKRTEQPLDAVLCRLRAVLERYGDIRRNGSAALDLASIAAGRINGFFEFGLQPWDIAAAKIILEEAGGKITNVDGTNNILKKNCSVVAGNICTHGELLDLIDPTLRTDLLTEWAKLRTELATAAIETQFKTAAGFPLSERMPPENVIIAWQRRYAAISVNWYGASHLSPLLYESLVTLSTAASATFYSLGPTNSAATRLLVAHKSADNYLSILDVELRGQYIRDYANTVRKNYTKSGGRFVGGNGINNTIYPSIMFTEDVQRQKAFKMWLRFFSKNNSKPLPEKARIWLWSFICAQIPAPEHSALSESFIAFTNKYPHALFNNNAADHYTAIREGVSKGEFKRLTFRTETPHRYLASDQWQRIVPLLNQGKLVRNKGAKESLYIRANEVPYMNTHGMALPGWRSIQENTYPDVERLCWLAEYMNPPQNRLPGEAGKPVIVARNSNTGSSISGTAHEQIYFGSIEKYPNYCVKNNPYYLQALDAALDLVQVGEKVDAFFLRLGTTKVRTVPILEFINNLIYSMQIKFNQEVIDFQIQVLPNKTGQFALIFIPFARLDKINGVAHNPTTGEASITYNIEGNMSCAVAGGTLLATSTQIDNWLDDGKNTLRRQYDFAALAGTYEFVCNHIRECFGQEFAQGSCGHYAGCQLR